MRRKILVPLWQIVVGLLLAAWATLDRLLLPSVRWFFRRRVNRAIEEVNTRMHIKLPAFKLTKRRVLIDRLLYDVKVVQAAEEYCRTENVPKVVAMEHVERYAREIVPTFNAYIYFRLGTWLSRTLARSLYRVRIGSADQQSLNTVDPNASLVFVMNHRSNMDYILLSYLAADHAALSYAVGEWARIWPIQQLIQSMGAFFVRRGSGNVLYRRVLERYVQMATEGGVVQAIFPEGGLTRDGKLRNPKIGLMDYMLRQFNPNGERDLVFVPIGVNYDRVLEDRTLLLSIDPSAEKMSRGKSLWTTLRFIRRNLLMMMRGGWHRFGYAVVNFGTPISTRAYVATAQVDFRTLDRAARIEAVQHFAQTVMNAVGAIIPVVPVSLVASVFAAAPAEAMSSLEIKTRVQETLERLEAQGAHIYIPRNSREYAIEVGLRMLTLRRIVHEKNGLYQAAPKQMNVLHYYANAIEHL